MIKILALVILLALVKGQEPVPTFVIDFDVHPSLRYNKVFEHFKDNIVKMEKLFFYSVAPKYRTYFQENVDKYQTANSHVYYAMKSLAEITGFETYQTILVNSIVDFSSFCTSIVARMENNTIIHARNLDFDFPSLMSNLVYKALYKQNGVIIAEAPSIAGYIGAYTGLKYGTFTVSYNVRQLRNMSNIEENLKQEIEGVIPAAQLIQKALLESTSYNESVSILSKSKINTPCYIIVGGINENEGIVITRDREGVNHTVELSDTNWFVAQTNSDYWNTEDVRYNATVSAIESVGQGQINPENIVFDILRAKGVLQQITIFQASLSTTLNINNIYIVPQNSTTAVEGKEELMIQ